MALRQSSDDGGAARADGGAGGGPAQSERGDRLRWEPRQRAAQRLRSCHAWNEAGAGRKPQLRRQIAEPGGGQRGCVGLDKI